MGMIFADVCHLLKVRDGQSGGRALTLGRLSLFLHRSELRTIRASLRGDRAAQAWIDDFKWGQPADRFFHDVLRFDAVDSLDIADYEGATIIQDIGERVPAELEGRFDLIVDGGSLEHIFDFPVAIANVMRMARQDAIVYLNMPCNNLCGHGFYQFSPELMHRLFSPSSGYDLMFVRVAKARYLSIELSAKHRVYEVKDPAELGTRVNLSTSDPAVMMTMARRKTIREPLANKVLQSDYVARWGGAAPSGLMAMLKNKVRQDGAPAGLAPLAGLYMRWKASLKNRKHYRRVQ
jgi:hypothetical protein